MRKKEIEDRISPSISLKTWNGTQKLEFVGDSNISGSTELPEAYYRAFKTVFPFLSF